MADWKVFRCCEDCKRWEVTYHGWVKYRGTAPGALEYCADQDTEARAGVLDMDRADYI